MRGAPWPDAVAGLTLAFLERAFKGELIGWFAGRRVLLAPVALGKCQRFRGMGYNESPIHGGLRDTG
ncbi:hypothetical protein BV98_003070 [Sphingobium herbicidovorans NBRC 16415]|uniref:Uncharacterized protein n=1 Tax=Sphingobium herbicidovorans (strain ATCC 700291 / DSM 11019 / CCUG 56400 / KCTC 2939 / LMG 18315 / NBRC 16415 / MH) TaxID=1219045 RepID=A0A086P775_SPHHM|nr:hypothetical protein BV98_003070 [Sphingobium herbicidovorans NBRC 16415]